MVDIRRHVDMNLIVSEVTGSSEHDGKPLIVIMVEDEPLMGMLIEDAQRLLLALEKAINMAWDGNDDVTDGS